jgi:polyphosphate kinase
LLTPIEDGQIKRKLVEILGTYFQDNQNAWGLRPEGRYERLVPVEGQGRVRAQKVLYQGAVEKVKLAELAARTKFEPHLPSQG